MSNVVTVPRCPKQLVFDNPCHFYRHVTCHYLQDRFDFAMVIFLLFPNPLYFNSHPLQVGILYFTSSGGRIYPFLWGSICHYWIVFHYPTVYSGKSIDSERLYHRSTHIQMIGGFIHPGRPMANMYFVLYGYSKYHMLLSGIEFPVLTRLF